MPVVRSSGRRGCHILRPGVQELEERVMEAMLRMKKMYIAELERAAAEEQVGRRS
jgi:hypothetical protein